VGLGERRPVAPDRRPDGAEDPQGRARNRRVSISFVR
jgi:OOP family OmpA-OmpF porin